jgi:origin recognition complex subunit 3
LMLFYRALADLKLSGMVKPSRKKTDHLAKMAWKGL